MLSRQDGERLARFLSTDPYLNAYQEVIVRRIARISETALRLTSGHKRLADFAQGHDYFGLHFQDAEWVFREWAPGARAIHLVGAASNWKPIPEFALQRIDGQGVWEIRLPGDRLRHGDLYRLHVACEKGVGERIPAWARRVVQDPRTLIFNAQVWRPETPYSWRVRDFRVPQEPPLIYEVHIGMAQEEARVGTYAEFTGTILPRVKASGYNVLQIMAVPEHPYYGSFGYHVSSFFAPASRFGTPEELKALIDAAHAEGMAVLIDLVHSHAANNEVEGISRFDGTEHQYFHGGARGRHSAWDSRLFDYGKHQVLHFLLSNCRYWLEEFHVDGFRFDGITSMLYLHHGLGVRFTCYGDYFGDQVDEDALIYLALANQLIHTIRPDAVTIAEDVSGMPGLARPWHEGGIGFDYRFALNVPDYWIRLTKDVRDEDWPMDDLWCELTNRRHDERTISYAESHDQALVGDQTLISRLIGDDIYDHMGNWNATFRVERGVALHKMIRLITLATAGHGYLNFMGNEFGHPEWIDFPRPGNNWSYHYARRQWHLRDDPNLKYHALDLFDQAMIAMARELRLFSVAWANRLCSHTEDKVLIFERAGLILAFNFHPVHSYSDYAFPVPRGSYRVILDSDDSVFGGHDRIDRTIRHFSLSAEHPDHPPHRLSLYLPCRTAIVLAPTAS